MIAEPSVLFLDEPTSGLDSTTTCQLCETLKTTAWNRNMTISSVIHQPSYAAFSKFDDLLLLGKGGRVVYAGPLVGAPAYFASIGFPVPSDVNQADFYLDVINGVVKRVGYLDFRFEDLFHLWERHLNAHVGTDVESPKEITHDQPLPTESSNKAPADAGENEDAAPTGTVAPLSVDNTDKDDVMHEV